MAVFAVLLDKEANPTAVAERIAASYPDANFQFGERAWVVSGKRETAQGVCTKLGVKVGGLTGVAVTQLTASYWGVANTAFWAWLKTNFEKSDD